MYKNCNGHLIHIPSLTFRGFLGEPDLPRMMAVLQASQHEDRDETAHTLESVARYYRPHPNCDHSRDMIFAEIKGDVVGFGYAWWQAEYDGTYLYSVPTDLVPAWRGQGIRRAMLRFLEGRHRDTAQQHEDATAQYLYLEATEHAHDLNAVLQAAGYEIVRWWFDMVCSLDGDLPQRPLPEGFQVRPVQKADILPIWKAVEQAFRDHWGATEWPEDDLAAWRESPTFRPDLWHVAWDGDKIAGSVLNELNEAENTEQKRQRGYTDIISVGRPWRGCGLAKALIARSLHMWKDMGMTEVACAVDAASPTGALKLYEGLGYRPERTTYSWRKPLD